MELPEPVSDWLVAATISRLPDTPYSTAITLQHSLGPYMALSDWSAHDEMEGANQAGGIVSWT